MAKVWRGVLRVCKWLLGGIAVLYAILKGWSDAVGVVSLFDEPEKSLSLLEKGANWLFATPWWVPSAILIFWALTAFVLLRHGHPRDTNEKVADGLVPLATAVKRFGDAVPDVYASFMVAGALASKGVDGQMVDRAYRMWRIVPLQVMYRDSEKYKSVTMAERGMARLEFSSGILILTDPRETVSTDLAIKESDLQTAIARAPSTPPGGDLVLLKDAVKELYDGARNNKVVKFAEVQQTEDEKLSWLANQLWERAPLQVRFTISNLYKPLFREKREEHYLVFRNGAPLLLYDQGMEEQVAAQDIAVVRSNLDNAIQQFRASGRSSEN